MRAFNAFTAFVMVLTAATILYPRWIEIVFGIDPDHGSGALEVGILVACALVVVGQVAVRKLRTV